MNMLPCSAPDDPLNGREPDAVLFRKTSHRASLRFSGSESGDVLGTNRSNLILGKSGAVMPNALDLSAFIYLVLNIVRVRSKEKMVRPNTGGIVAPVKYPHPRRYFSKVDGPRRPVCSDYATRRYGKFKLPVSLSVEARGPQPALSGFAGVTPENIFHAFRFAHELIVLQPRYAIQCR